MREDIKVFLNPNPSEVAFCMEAVGISYCDETYRLVRPRAGISVLEYVISGKGTVETSSGTFHPVAGDSYLLHENDFHDYYADPDEPWIKIWVNFMGILPPAVLNSYGFQGSMLLPKIDISDYLQQIHKIAYNSSASTDIIYDQCFVIFVKMIQFIRQSLSGHNKLPDIPANIIQLKNYIDSHLDENLTLEKCNSITNLSTSQTIRSFRQVYGVPPYEYLNQQRIELAKILLRGSLYSLQDIAQKIGFSDPYYFSKYFKKRTGQSPKDFRNYKQRN